MAGCVQVKKMEQLLRLKDAKIDALTAQLNGAIARGAPPTR